MPRGETFQVRVVENVWETPTVFLLRLQRADGRPLEFVAGQWILVRLEHEGQDLRRAYSIASPPHLEAYFELCVKKVPVGAMSPVLAAMKPGDVFDCAGPFGRVVLVDPVDTNLLFVATGTGIAPFRAMIDTLFHRGTGVEVLLLFGVRREDQIIYGAHFSTLAEAHENFRFIPTLSRPEDGWTGHRGHVQKLVAEYVDGYHGEEVYLCGIPEMVDEVKETFLALGAPKERVHTEKWY